MMSLFCNFFGLGMTPKGCVRMMAALLIFTVAPSAMVVGNAQTQSKSQNVPATRAPLRFDVVSVKPASPGDPMVPDKPQQGGYWVVRAVPIPWLIYFTFDTQPSLVEGLPDWVRGQRYTVEAHMPPSTTDADLHLMLQSMLRDRFGMKWHSEMRAVDVSILSAGSPGPDLHPASGHCLAPGEAIPPDSKEYACGVVHVAEGSNGIEFAGSSVTLGAIATFLTRLRIQPVVDAAGSSALYDFEVTVAPPEPYPGEAPGQRNFDTENALQTAFKKQLGIDLDMTHTVKRSIPVMVIDHLERASAN